MTLTSNSLPRQARRRAVSLIEGVLYLVISLAVLIGGLTFFQQAEQKNEIVNLTQDMTLATQAAIQALAANSDFAALGDDVDYGSNAYFDMGAYLKDAGQLPVSLHRSADQTATNRVVTPWGTPLDILLMVNNGLHRTYLVMGMHDVPTQVCMAMMTSDAEGNHFGQSFYASKIVNFTDNMDWENESVDNRTLATMTGQNVQQFLGGTVITPQDVAEPCQEGNDLYFLGLFSHTG